MFNQAIDLTNNSLPSAQDVYNMKCHTLMLLDLRARKLTQLLAEMHAAIEALEIEINKGDNNG